MRRPGKKSGVHATRVGYEQTSLTGEDLAQAFRFLIECGGCVHDLQFYWNDERLARLPHLARGGTGVSRLRCTTVPSLRDSTLFHFATGTDVPGFPLSPLRGWG